MLELDKKIDEYKKQVDKNISLVTNLKIIESNTFKYIFSTIKKEFTFLKLIRLYSRLEDLDYKRKEVGTQGNIMQLTGGYLEKEIDNQSKKLNKIDRKLEKLVQTKLPYEESNVRYINEFSVIYGIEDIEESKKEKCQIIDINEYKNKRGK